MKQSLLFDVRVKSITWLAINVHSVVLEKLDGQPLPSAQAGSHIDVHLSDKLSRSYSIVGNAGDPSRYEFAVARDANSRGGSRYIHETLRVGAELKISEPRNLFPLVQDAPQTVLVAGGIGITPLWAMAQRLETLGRAWTLFYAARSRKHAAYIAEIEALAAKSKQGHLITHFDDVVGAPPNVASVVNAAPATAHLYCCGPQPMLAAFESAGAARPAAQIHLERFAPAQSTEDTGAFKVRLTKAGMEFAIPPGRSILDVLLEHNIDAQYGCMQGACGLCEVKVLDGIPDHRDTLLSAQAKEANQSILICCSRSKTPTLTLEV
jgi:vanillate O-demethylase ferredoxin subunit